MGSSYRLRNDRRRRAVQSETDTTHHGVARDCIVDFRNGPHVRVDIFYATTHSHETRPVVQHDSGGHVLGTTPTHIAAASAGLTDPSVAARMHVTTSLRGAREELRVLNQRLNSLSGLHYVTDETAGTVVNKVDELSVILMALAVEVRGKPHGCLAPEPSDVITLPVQRARPRYSR